MNCKQTKREKDMNIDDLTYGQIKEISNLMNVKPEEKTLVDRDFGLVVCQFIGRFVFVANMKIIDGFCYLENVRNVRYWAERPNGLGGLATDGEIAGDKIDYWPDQIIPENKLGPVMIANKEKWS